MVTTPGDDSTGHIVPVPGALLGVLDRCPVRGAKCFLDKSLSRMIRPHHVRCHFRGVLGGYNVSEGGFRILHRAFTAHYIRTGVSVGALDRVLKRSSIDVAVGQCIRPSLDLGQGDVRGLTSFVTIGWSIGFGGSTRGHVFTGRFTR